MWRWNRRCDLEAVDHPAERLVHDCERRLIRSQDKDPIAMMGLTDHDCEFLDERGRPIPQLERDSCMSSDRPEVWALRDLSLLSGIEPCLAHGGVDSVKQVGCGFPDGSVQVCVDDDVGSNLPGRTVQN